MECCKSKIPGVYLFSERPEINNNLGFEVLYSHENIRNVSGLKNVFSYHYETEFMFKNTLRGFFIQNAPWTNNLLMKCVNGSCRVIVLDVRDTTETYQHYTSRDLLSSDGNLLYVPIGVAHAFLSLEDNTRLYILSDNIISEKKNITINVFETLAGSGIIPAKVISSVETYKAPRLSEIERRYW
ncbi:dTDP-4-dehydrorhamnose 3,5-epimerase family protein [Pyramidobacter sp. YE332]|uniref:dTDP-4-dehydrorhamnose 3,5-epimerase family protein n=1 Tax=Pyramidobacter sp. YE332 TaxID=3068894 RepID=UPI00294B2747|nr:dTDP-4-dehydrorhamnose 3,5-epimerase family protein [Pyramidobacter sp. YE332]WOL38947.1 dTDP-4-dehydrorhamnose 3,5-epimerase family protein [Pyramidobacter sp. YE332]